MKAQRKTKLTRSLVCALILCVPSVASSRVDRGAEQRLSALDVALPDLNGRWLQRVVLTTVMRVPVIGRMRSTTETWAIVEVEQDGERVQMTSEVCRVAIDSGTLVRTVIPEAFVRSLPRRSYDLALRSGDAGPQLDGWSLSQSVGMIDDSGDAPLPTEPSDPRVRDTDHDSQPGVTISLRGLVRGDLYLVQRVWTDYTTSQVNSESIRGNVRWRQQQVILEATRESLEDPPESWPDPRSERNWFAMQPAASHMSCGTLNERVMSFQ